MKKCCLFYIFTKYSIQYYYAVNFIADLKKCSQFYIHIDVFLNNYFNCLIL